MDDFLDYLTREIETSFRLGKQVWEKANNHRAKRQLVKDAMSRAKALYDLSKNDNIKKS